MAFYTQLSRYLLSILAINFTAFPWLQFSQWCCTVYQNRYCRCSWRVIISFTCIFAYFHNELRELKVWRLCRRVAYVRFQILNWRSFHSRPAFFLTGLIICSSHLPLPKNLHRPLIYRTGRLGDSIFQYFTFFHSAFWFTKRPVRSHAIYGVMKWS